MFVYWLILVDKIIKEWLYFNDVRSLLKYHIWRQHRNCTSEEYTNRKWSSDKYVRITSIEWIEDLISKLK
jgi:hypothetical protein